MRVQDEHRAYSRKLARTMKLSVACKVVQHWLRLLTSRALRVWWAFTRQRREHAMAVQKLEAMADEVEQARVESTKELRDELARASDIHNAEAHKLKISVLRMVCRSCFLASSSRAFRSWCEHTHNSPSTAAVTLPKWKRVPHGARMVACHA